MLGDVGIDARRYLIGRGITEETIRKAGLGFIPKNDNKADFQNTAERWGMTGDDITLYSGILFPYEYKRDIWKIRIRRLGNDVPKEERYRSIRGSANGLYRADDIKPGGPATVFEGEIDALSAWQSAGNEVACVALGGTPGARIPTWVTRLSLASDVLLCFDNEEDPDKTAAAIEYWSKRLDNARVYHLPGAYHDANDMLQKGDDLHAWIQSGLSTPALVAGPSTQALDLFECSDCHVDLNDLEQDAYFDEDGIAFCGGCWLKKRALDLVVPVFGPVQEVKVCRIGEYTLDQRVADLEREARAEQKLRQLSPRLRRELVSAS
jgi:hypothetical protein